MIQDPDKTTTAVTELGSSIARAHAYIKILGVAIAVVAVVIGASVAINGCNAATATDRAAEAKTTATQAAPKAKKAAKMEARKEAIRTRTIIRKQTRTIVKRELGRRGATGRPPTVREIDAAVARAMPGVLDALKTCVASGGCGDLRGPAGKDGAPAPPLTDEQLADAVRPLVFGYCASQGCGTPGPRGEKGDRGEQGDKGEQGEPGAAGVGVDGAPGPPPQPFSFTFTDPVSGTAHTCTIDPNVGPTIVQACAPLG